MLTVEQIRERIEKGLPEARVQILDPRKEGVHLKAIVSYKGFEGQSLIQQHRMVFDTLQLK